MPDNEVFAPGWPGTPSRWTSSDKSGVGTALSRASHVWFTLSHGILTEVYYPRLDWACIRDLGLLVTDGHTFFSEEKCDARHAVDYLAEGVPAYRLTNTCLQGRYRIEKEVVADPERDVILQRIRFVPLQGSLDDYHLYELLAPHLGNQGAGNTAWLGETKGEPMLFAERSGTALALAASVPWAARSVGYVGVSDGWQDLQKQQRLTWRYTRAENGNVAMVGEIDPASAADGFILALAFAPHALGAGHLARASLQDGFEAARQAYIRGWAEWQQTVLASEGMEDAGHNQLNFYRISTAVLHTHEAKEFAGGTIASLSIPWGHAKGDNDLGGYHLVWTRDMAETIGGLLAAGARTSVRRVLGYLQATQEADGRWPQNMWLDGTAYWNGVQMEEVGFPVLVCDLAWRQGVLTRADMIRTWPMVRRAAAFLVRHGPVTGQDRWEEDPGYAPFTLAVEIVALLAAAELAELAAGRPHEALRLLHAMEAFANAGGMMPEQIWDKPDIPAQDLVFGHAAGLGPCRISEVAPVDPGGPGHGYAATGAAALRAGSDRKSLYDLAVQP